ASILVVPDLAVVLKAVTVRIPDVLELPSLAGFFDTVLVGVANPRLAGIVNTILRAGVAEVERRPHPRLAGIVKTVLIRVAVIYVLPRLAGVPDIVLVRRVSDTVVVVITEVVVAVENRGKNLRVEVQYRGIMVHERVDVDRGIADHRVGQGGVPVGRPTHRDGVVDHVARGIDHGGARHFIRARDAADFL